MCRLRLRKMPSAAVVSFVIGEQHYCVDTWLCARSGGTGTTDCRIRQPFARDQPPRHWPVIDLRKRFGKEPTEPTLHVVVIVAVARSRRASGDGVSDIVTVIKNIAPSNMEGEDKNPTSRTHTVRENSSPYFPRSTEHPTVWAADFSSAAQRTWHFNFVNNSRSTRASHC